MQLGPFVRFYTENGRFAFLSPPPLEGLGQHIVIILGSLESV